MKNVFIVWRCHMFEANELIAVCTDLPKAVAAAVWGPSDTKMIWVEIYEQELNRVREGVVARFDRKGRVL